MTHRILAPIKSFALSVGLRLAAGKSKRPFVAAPEPRTRYISPNMVDEWMFDRDGTPVTEAAEVYSRDLGRVAGALGTLRNLLSEISAHQPLRADLPVDAAFGPIMSDDVLFDGEPMAPYYADAPMEDAELFMDVIASEKATQGNLSHVA
ncbi:hypothetical protein [Hyphomonas pacifica]|uniref:hypothetical protein n=1 Tax=Hyphomonas pacifica TaxID=1280941 RepID=UPI000DBF6160|nr:hypothetical protein [Hyphomonas pacifica]RAN35709.1 hypothetical protein HY11_13220 [Hyphomonas pacifica]